MAMVTYECFICGGSIDASNKLDPCYLQIDTNMGGDEEEKLEQGFFCHYDCFKGIMNNDGHLNLEGQDGSVAYNYLQSEKYEKAVERFEKVLPTISADETEYLQFLLVGLIQCHKALKDVTKQKEYLKRGLDLCNLGHESAGIYYEAAAAAYADGDFQKSKSYIEKYRITYEAQAPEDSEERKGFEAKGLGAILALHLADDKDETVRSMCSDWLDGMADYVPTSLEETRWCNAIDASIQYLKDADLMYRLAKSTFIRSSMPSVEFASNGLAERMLGNHEKAYQEFLKYKQVFKEQLEYHGEDFEEVWEEQKSITQEVNDFVIPDNDPPLATLVDEYITKYGEQTDEEG